MEENVSAAAPETLPEASPPQADGEGQQAGAGEPEGRDFDGEVGELLREFPDAGKEGRLPDEVVRGALEGGKSVMEAYRDYALARQGRESAGEWNRRNAQRAPVRGVSGGFAVGDQKLDPFISGFDEV